MLTWPLWGHGANANVSIVFDHIIRSLAEMVDQQRPLPVQLHVQLDNCPSENKTYIMFCMLGWLLVWGKDCVQFCF